jgi:hypothetical protein
MLMFPETYGCPVNRIRHLIGDKYLRSSPKIIYVRKKQLESQDAIPFFDGI